MAATDPLCQRLTDAVSGCPGPSISDVGMRESPSGQLRCVGKFSLIHALAARKQCDPFHLKPPNCYLPHRLIRYDFSGMGFGENPPHVA
jgi:hypothetical protein